MNKRFLSLATPLAIPLVGAMAQQQHPNILWIITDDQRADALECVNRVNRGTSENALGYVHSPNIDKLAEEGVLFVNSFCNSPVSAPSRGSMHTGRYPFHSGIYSFEVTHNASEFAQPLVPEIMREQGYQTAIFGKSGYYIFQYSDPMRYTNANYYEVEVSDKNLQDNKMTDWHKYGIYDKEGKVGDVEIWNYPDGEQVQYYQSKRGGLPEGEMDRVYAFQERQQIVTYPGKPLWSIIGGESPMPTEKTLDGRTVEELGLYLNSVGKPYDSLCGSKRQGADNTRPQFINLGFHFPHTPVTPPKEWREKFKDVEYTLPTISPEEYDKMTAQMQKWQNVSDISELSDEQKMQCVRDYYAFCAMGDQLIGKAVEKFKAYCDEQDQPYMILLATGDHGWHLGEQGVYCKSSAYLKSNQTAVIVCGSDKDKFPAGTVKKDFIEYVDFAPTFFREAGVNIADKRFDYLDGRSIVATIHEEEQPRDYVLGETNHIAGHRAYMRGKEFSFSMRSRKNNVSKNYPPCTDIQWALNCTPKQAEMALFDLRVDPEERNNVAYDPEYQRLAEWFRSKLGSIVLGDNRVECDWKQPLNTYEISSFAVGSDDKELDIPKRIIPKVKR